jgi:hypothetical protein
MADLLVCREGSVLSVSTLRASNPGSVCEEVAAPRFAHWLESDRSCYRNRMNQNELV